jgi:hypothetical protein
VPFSAEAVEGWRAWSVIERDGDVWLASLTRPEEWEPETPFAATCERRTHQPPRRGCSCGVYAAAEPAELAGLGRIAGAAVGRVSLWGRVAEHSRGFRAARAYPAMLRLVCVTCLSEGVGTPATRVDRDGSSGRTRLLPLCTSHADGRALTAAAEVEERLLARYRVEPVPDGSIAKIRRDRRVEDAERRSRRRALVTVVAALSLLSVIALAGAIAQRGAPTPSPAAAVPSVRGDESIKLPHDRTSDGLIFAPSIRVLLLSPHRFVVPKCGRVTPSAVIPVECHDDRAEVFVVRVAPVGPRRGSPCSDETTVVTRRGDRLMCWRPLPTT